MGFFTYKEYIKDGKKVLKVNILPERYCTFDCIFAPAGGLPISRKPKRTFPEMMTLFWNLKKYLMKRKTKLTLSF